MMFAAPVFSVVLPSLDALTVNAASERGLSAASVSAAAALVEQHGVALIRGAAEPELVEECRAVVERNFAACRDALDRKGVTMDDGFAHAEIVHRAKRRYDMQLGEAAQEPLPPSVLDGAPWVPVMRKLMGDDAINLFTGAVVAEPGAADQPLHMDGGHLWQGTHGFEQPQCPPHCCNVFLPLVDVTAENGPTEFWPGSHVIGKARDAYDGGEPGVALAGAVGDIIVFDYRVVHRGMANAATAARPVLYSTFSRPWFRDALNFPDDALFGAKGGGGSGGFGGGGGKAKKGKAGKKKR